MAFNHGATEPQGELIMAHIGRAEDDVQMITMLYARMVHYGHEREAKWALHKAGLIADALVVRVLS